MTGRTECSIDVSHHPLPVFESVIAGEDIAGAIAAGYAVSYSVAFGMSFMIATFVVFFIAVSGRGVRGGGGGCVRA